VLVNKITLHGTVATERTNLSHITKNTI